MVGWQPIDETFARNALTGHLFRRAFELAVALGKRFDRKYSRVPMGLRVHLIRWSIGHRLRPIVSDLQLLNPDLALEIRPTATVEALAESSHGSTHFVSVGLRTWSRCSRALANQSVVTRPQGNGPLVLFILVRLAVSRRHQEAFFGDLIEIREGHRARGSPAWAAWGEIVLETLDAALRRPMTFRFGGIPGLSLLFAWLRR